MKITENKYLYNIDIWRFMLATFILYYHITPIMSKYYDNNLFLENLSKMNNSIGQVAVLAFFIIGGFFFYQTKSFKKYTFLEFIKKRITRMFPLLAFSLLINLHSETDLLNALFISSGIGVIRTPSSNPASWFVCVLFWIELFTFFRITIMHNQKTMYFEYVWGGVGFILLAQRTDKTVYSALAFGQIPLLTNGMLMGLTGFELGMILGQIFEKYEPKFVLSKKETVIVTILELFILIYFIWILVFDTRELELFYYVVVFLLIMIDFTVKCGYIARFLNKKLYRHLGECAYGIYLMQFPCFKYLKSTLWKYHMDVKQLLIYSIFICVGVGIIAHYCVEVPCQKRMKAWLERKR